VNKTFSKISLFLFMSILLTSGFGNFMIQDAFAAIPTITGATTTTTTSVTVTFSEPVFDDGGSGSDYEACFRVGGQVVTGDALPTTATGTDTDVVLTFATPIATDATPNVSYLNANCSGGGTITISDVASSTPMADDATTPTTDGLSPVFSSAVTGSSTSIVVTMNEGGLIEVGVDTPGAWVVGGILTNDPITVTNVAVAGTDVTLTLDSVIVNGDTVTITYTNPGGANEITDAAGNEIASFGSQTVANTVAAVVVPTTEKKKGGGGCDGDCTPPTIGLDKNGVRLVDNGFSYNNNAVDAILFHTPFPLISAQIGNTNTVSIKAWENSGPQGITLTQIGLGVPEIGSPLNDAEVIVEIWTSNTEVEEIVITDPHNLIENSSVSAQTDIVNCRADSDAQCLDVTLNYMYREAPLYNVMSVEVMDMSRNVQSTTFNDGVEVLGDSMNPADTINVLPKAPQNYPQTSGTVLLTQIDRAEQMWVDPYGYLWQGDKSKMTLISEIPFVRFNDSESEFTGYSSRLNSNFVMYKEEQIEKAQMAFDYLTYYKQIQGDDLTGYVGKTFDNVKLERADDVTLQQSIVDEQIRAAVIFEKILDASFVPKN
jgi:hypothetical protein